MDVTQHGSCRILITATTSSTGTLLDGPNRTNSKRDTGEGCSTRTFEFTSSNERFLKNPIVRRLYNESHAIFLAVQSQAKAVSPHLLGADELTMSSLQYRAALRSACQSLESADILNNLSLANDDNDDYRRDSAALAAVYRASELVWSLIELLYFKAPGNSITVDLLGWARLNFTEADSSSIEILQWATEGSRPEHHPKFWQTVVQFIVFGRFEDGRKLLRSHSRRSETCFDIMDEILRKVPLLSLGQGDATQFREWQVASHLKSGLFVTCPQLETIARIISGDMNEWNRVLEVGVLEHWYELLVGLVLYKRPEVSLGDLMDIAQESIRMVAFGDREEPSVVDRVLLALIDLDVLEAVRTLSVATSDWWMVAHVCDLLAKAGSESLTYKHERKGELDLREYLLLEYGSSLMEDVAGLWEIGLTYLESCRQRGEAYIEAFLELLPLDREQDAVKIVEACNRYDMGHLGTGVCREISLRALRGGHVHEALTWAIRCKDQWLLELVVERALWDFGRVGLIASLPLVDRLEHSALQSPALIFLYKYRELHQLLSDDGAVRAGILVAELLSSRVAPRKFWPVLFDDALQLFNRQPPVIDKEASYKLVEILQTMTDEMEILKSTAYLDATDESGLYDRMTAIRLTLLQNLSRAIVVREERMQVL